MAVFFLIYIYIHIFYKFDWEMIALQRSIIWKIDLSDSTLDVTLDEPTWANSSQPIRFRRRRRNRRLRKFRCVLVRFAVYGSINGRRRSCNRYRYLFFSKHLLAHLSFCSNYVFHLLDIVAIKTETDTCEF